MRRGLALLALPLAVGCGQEPCGAVGRAIADRTLVCEGSSSMGIGRARALQYTYTCPVDSWWDELRGVPGACVDAIEDLGCDTVRANGSDLAAWLDADPSCDALTPSATTAAGGGDDSGEGGGGGGGDDTGEAVTLPCSSDGGAEATLTVTNDSGVAVDIYWRDGLCEEHTYQLLAPGDRHTQGTFTGHVWVARELTGARALVDFTVVEDAPEASWSITQ